ncbi:hypothetical protein B0H10DRAFT_2010369 [Mycena sp. CBHHK59/15]|nr:hypothetical protein B0H10DRAFT_2010369 [Mycena sp. CBHHK59/15]
MPQSEVPPLTLICLRILLTSFSDAEFSENIVPFIPSHLRHDLLRWTTVHSPLNSSQLDALCGPDRHTDGELIIIGPNATVREDQFRHLEPEERTSEWESDDWLPPPPLHTFILVSAHLGFPTLCNLPATISRLALINLPTPVSLHRLPTTCPLIEVLDLSFNSWLVTEKEAQERLGKVQWSRWHQLRTLGFRECRVTAQMVAEVNKGRWDDVIIIK